MLNLGLLEQSRRYNPLTNDEIADAAGNIAADGRKHHFKNGIPSQKWVYNLLKKYDDILSFKRISNIPMKRIAAGMDLEGINKWYQDVGNGVLYEICELEGISREQLTAEHFVVLDETCLNPGDLFYIDFDFLLT